MTGPTFARYFGEGPRQTLALHCALGQSANWRDMAEALSDRVSITAIDLPGHGRSADWDRVADLHQVSTDAAADTLGQGPMDVIGHSFGATVALRLAVERPNAVRSLTLIEPVFFAAARQNAPLVFARYMDAAAPFADALASGDLEAAARLFHGQWGDGTPWADVSSRTRRYITSRIHMVAGHAPGIIEDNARLLAPGRAERLGMPVLLLEGSETSEIISAVNAARAARLPRARIAQVKGAAHMVPLTHPHAVAKEILQLLEMA